VKLTCLENVGASTSHKSYEPPRPVKGIALLFFTLHRMAYHSKINTSVKANGIATGYGLDDRQAAVRVPVGSKNLFSAASRPVL
jgi:hypothetical protein